MARRRIGKGVFVALMHFYISTSMLILAVVLYMMRFSFVADHWQYFGSMSMIALVASGITQAMDRIREPWDKPLEMALGIGLVLGLGALTWAQSGMYSDIETLWRTTLARNPACWMAHNNLGLALFNRGRTEEAVAQYREALRIHPRYAEAHTNLGSASLQEGRTQESIAQYREACEINPADANAHCNLGVVLCQQGLIEEAIGQYREAVRINPAFAQAHYNLGNVLRQQGRTEEAISEYREAVRIDPAFTDAQHNLDSVLRQQAGIEEAIADAQEVLELHPANPAVQNNLAWMLATASQASLRNGARAVLLATQASQESGGKNPLILRTLAAAYAQAGQFPNAVQTAQMALQAAGPQGNTALAGALRREIKLYGAAQPYRDPP